MAFSQPLDLTTILAIVAATGGVLCIAILIFRAVRLYRNKKLEKQQSVRVEAQPVAGSGSAESSATLDEHLVLARNVIAAVGHEGQIAAGTYALSAADGEEAFNLRLNGLVREYHNGDTVTLTDGDTLCPVSGAVIVTPSK